MKTRMKMMMALLSVVLMVTLLGCPNESDGNGGSNGNGNGEVIVTYSDLLGIWKSNEISLPSSSTKKQYGEYTFTDKTLTRTWMVTDTTTNLTTPSTDIITIGSHVVDGLKITIKGTVPNGFAEYSVTFSDSTKSKFSEHGIFTFERVN